MARRSTAGAVTSAKPALTPVNNRRRDKLVGKKPLGMGFQWINNRTVL
jgi:hypothetical protein